MTTDTSRRIEYVPIDNLERAPRNPKGHDTDGIRASINRHGFVEPVIVDERTGRLVGGHGRLDQLRQLQASGAAPPAGVTTDADGAWCVPVVYGWQSASDAEAEALLIALNRLPEAGGIAAPDVLLAMLDELAQTAHGLDGTGYTADDLDDLLADLGAGELPEADTDADYAPLPDRAEPQAPRETQGLREVGLMFTADDHREYQALLVVLKKKYAEDAAPVVVLRAMAEAAAE
jgi:hypothetical protein